MNFTVETFGGEDPTRPEGYTERASSSRWECDRCGARVGRTELHDAFHVRIDPRTTDPA